MFDLYVITDDRCSLGRSHAEVAEEALKGWADVIQLRMKGVPDAEIIEQAMSIKPLCEERDAFFIINDRLDIAMEVGADGVHLGQGDMPISEARAITGDAMIIGISTKTVEEARKAEADGADYIGFGPVFDTSSKDDAGPALGLDALHDVCTAVNIPVVAIGGINEHNIRDVILAGADSAAVISAVAAKEDIPAAVRNLRDIIRRARPLSE
jgi:thiamine-phosphate pyrophosphorylase